MRDTACKDAYYFHEGTAIEAYRYLGVHYRREGEGYRYTFRVFAPRAESVSLIGDLLDWDTGLPMERVTEGGVFELTLYDTRDLAGFAYKFAVTARGERHLKGDPYAFSSRGGDDGASLIYDPFSYHWQDEEYLAVRRLREDKGELPMNVFEVHLASFCRREDGGYLSYGELAELLLGYAKYMGYTHVELLPVTEYPYDASWGYQVCAYYAPTSRFGTPAEFAAFVDRLHAGGVGVILDWVPAHFPKDEWGLYEFDGEPLYEYAIPWRQESRSWGTRYFDLGRREVTSFLISSALFWLREYHIDGLRVDAVASMLYLDYDRREGEWERNAEGGNHDLRAAEFFRALSAAVRAAVPDALLIAEESTDYPGVTAPPEEGGLGFHMKWNMGFSNDLFAYLSAPPEARVARHSALNFPITYAFRERYILPISHDEVVHGKGSFFGKMYGEYEERLACFRVALLFFMTFPGKKLMFMGTEYGAVREWDFDSEAEWQLTEDPRHDALREYVAALNRFYLSSPALYELDFSQEGFSWLLADEAERKMLSYMRHGKDGDHVAVALSFSECEGDICLSLPCGGRYAPVFCTGEWTSDGDLETEGPDHWLRFRLLPRSGVILRRVEEEITL
ncbi:MAG: 1,4-alpha-glucan branching protein GlgB [Clostridia bacterium]|nr:1,4-alpha-glucan branching protein GlgB [Clostridia bacterium]